MLVRHYLAICHSHQVLFFFFIFTHYRLCAVPLVQQSLEIVDQIPPLLRIIADGKSEFEPTPIDTKEVCRLVV